MSALSLDHALRLAEITARRMAGAQADPALAVEDLTSVAYLAAWKALRDFQPGRGAQPRTWIITQCRAAILSELRALDHLSRSERKAVSADGASAHHPLSLDALLQDGEGAPGRLTPLWHSEEQRDGAPLPLRVRDALSALHAEDWRDARALWLIGAEGLTTEEAGKRIGLSVTPTRRRYHRAIGRIRLLLGLEINP